MRGVCLSFFAVLVAFAAVLPAVAADEEELLRGKIKATLFAPDPLPALDALTHGRFEIEPGITAERVTYSTQFGMRVPAILYLPQRRSGRIPALIVVNGHGGDKYSWYAFYSGVLYARADAAVLTYDPIGEGERNSARKSGTRAHDKVQQPEELGRMMGGLMLTDVMQAAAYLTSRPEVDPKRIAAVGYSMGSFVLSVACAVETRLRACVLAGGGNLDGPGGYWDRSKPMCQGIPYRSLGFLGDRPAVLYSLHASRGATLIYNGLEDTTVAIDKYPPPFFEDLRRRTARMRGSERGLFETRFEPGAGHRPWFITRPVALWLEREIDFPNWTSAGIEQMPVTHISEWAEGHGVALDRLYATEHREGGTMALGEGIPALSRNDLSAFSAGEWEKHKHLLIYESWLDRARSQLQH